MNWKHLRNFSSLRVYFSSPSSHIQILRISISITEEYSSRDKLIKSIPGWLLKVTRCLQRNYFNNLLKCFIGWMKCAIFFILTSGDWWLLSMVNEAIFLYVRRYFFFATSECHLKPHEFHIFTWTWTRVNWTRHEM